MKHTCSNLTGYKQGTKPEAYELIPLPKYTSKPHATLAVGNHGLLGLWCKSLCVWGSDVWRDKPVDLVAQKMEAVEKCLLIMTFPKVSNSWALSESCVFKRLGLFQHLPGVNHVSHLTSTQRHKSAQVKMKRLRVNWSFGTPQFEIVTRLVKWLQLPPN